MQVSKPDASPASPSGWGSEILAGLTTSFAMVPEVVAFAFVTKVNPLVGLYAAFIAGLITAVFGGRPGMITGGAGSLAVVTVSLVVAHGPQYLFAAVVGMGIIQLIVGLLKWGKFVQMVPLSVMQGFVNGLAVVIFLAQLQHLQTETPSGLRWEFGIPFWITMALIAVTMAITEFMPRLTRAVPPSLAAIGITSLAVFFLHIPTRTVGDLASLAGTFPMFHLPGVPLTWETVTIVLPYAAMLAAVGLAESLLTLNLVDQLTDTKGDNDRECIGQGIGNVATGFFGGMGACAMIGQSVINVSSGGKKRLSSIVEALCILAFILFASGLIERVPIAALTGVMFVVVLKTFAWSSLRILHKIPVADAVVLVTVSVVTVFTNLAIAVCAGIVLASLKFVWENALQLSVARYDEDGGHRIYELHGPLFFASVGRFSGLFDVANDPDDVTIDFRFTQLYDHSALDAIARVAEEYQAAGKTIHLRHLSSECQAILSRGDTFVTQAKISTDPHRHIRAERLS